MPTSRVAKTGLIHTCAFVKRVFRLGAITPHTSILFTDIDNAIGIVRDTAFSLTANRPDSLDGIAQLTDPIIVKLPLAHRSVFVIGIDVQLAVHSAAVETQAVRVIHIRGDGLDHDIREHTRTRVQRIDSDRFTGAVCRGDNDRRRCCVRISVVGGDWISRANIDVIHAAIAVLINDGAGEVINDQTRFFIRRNNQALGRVVRINPYGWVIGSIFISSHWNCLCCWHHTDGIRRN